MLFRAALALMLIVALAPSPARAEADGPDFWEVSGVAPGDTLNMRMGPGTEYMVIGTLRHDARALQAITCTPYLTFAIWERIEALWYQDLSTIKIGNFYDVNVARAEVRGLVPFEWPFFWNVWLDR